jgi:HTH-type transcriptional regulator / antitoxin HigA
MTNISLGQAWVSRITNSESPDQSVIGGDPRPLPDAAELKAVLRKLALSDAAREMVRRKWFYPPNVKDKVEERGEALFDFLFASRASANRPAFALFKGRRLNTTHRDFFEEVSTMAWLAHVTDTAQSHPCKTSFKASNISDEFIRNLAKLSVLSDGPKRALNVVREIGINVVVEGSLPNMSIDGASFHTTGIGPVLAMTLRYDRLDNFWFTLLHELGHIALHLVEPSDDVFVDSIEGDQSDIQEAEAEADAFAKDGLVPRDTWLRSDAHRLGSESSVVNLAKQLGIHPAIVAGRIRYERKEFRIFNGLVGVGGVRDLIFAD